MKKIYRVVAGILLQDECVLCGKRGKGFFEDKWEFPGGKIELNETKIDAVKRELKEEINYEVDKCNFFMSTKVEYEKFLIYLDTYLVGASDCKPIANIHQELKWEKISELLKYDWCEADKVVVNKIIEIGVKNLYSIINE